MGKADVKGDRKEHVMKLVTTVLTAAMIAGSATVAMAQANSDEVNPGLVGRGQDDNPSLANPRAGNPAVAPWDRRESPSYTANPSWYGPGPYR
jgi:hypothetical protein